MGRAGITVAICIVLLIGNVFSLAVDHNLIKRSTQQRGGTVSEDRGRQIEEQTRDNHRAVINELNQRFEGYKENCFPMPKGCRCQVGSELIRHMEESKCKNPVTSTARPGPFGRTTTRSYWRTTTAQRTTTTRRRG